MLLREAGARPRRLTLGAPAGERRVEILDRFSACAAAAKEALYCAPLPKEAPIDKPTTGYEDLRMVALTRLVLAEIATADPCHVEVDWHLYGPKLAQVALTFGADHLDHVGATSDPALGPRRDTVADVERNIRAAGFEPRELRLPA
jgi:2-iminoacetate synthase ThiH